MAGSYADTAVARVDVDGKVIARQSQRRHTGRSGRVLSSSGTKRAASCAADIEHLFPKDLTAR